MFSNQEKPLKLLPHHQTVGSLIGLNRLKFQPAIRCILKLIFFCKNLTNFPTSKENSKPQLMLICILQFCNLQKISCFFSCCRLENCFSSTICPRRMFCETNTSFFFFAKKHSIYVRTVSFKLLISYGTFYPFLADQ